MVNRIEIAPDHGNDGEHANTLRLHSNAEQQKRVAEALNLIAESDAADAVVDAMGLKTHLDDPQNPVRTFLMNTDGPRLRLFVETSFKKAQESLQKAGDVQGLLALKATQTQVLNALDKPATDDTERPAEERRAA
ncbi:MAG TPA: hypothetical protein PKV72_00930 [Candidatus Peribacteria bacterium]|nr:hypothetical protein [Candidatus Peribacteria bacterium]